MPEETYEQYIDRVMEDNLAIRVKLHDLADKMDLLHVEQLDPADLKRYNKQLAAYHRMKRLVEEAKANMALLAVRARRLSQPCTCSRSASLVQGGRLSVERGLSSRTHSNLHHAIHLLALLAATLCSRLRRTLPIGQAIGMRTPPPWPTTFQWEADQFADIRVLRYQIPGWEQLSLATEAALLLPEHGRSCRS